MAGKQVAGDGLSANLAGMSKNQLYDIMCQMKTLIEQNQQQARQILIQNPGLTKGLFQAQIILGMVQPPQQIPSSQPTSSQVSQPSLPLIEQPRTQGASSLPTQIGLQEETRMQQLNQPAIASAPLLASNVQPPAFSSHQLQPVNQPKGTTQMPLPAQSSHIPNIHQLPHHSSSQPPLHLQPPMVLASNPLQQPIQPSSITQMPRQPPLPQQPRPHMPFTHSGHHPQMAPNMGFEHARPPQLHHSQPGYHLGNKPPVMQGQPPYMLQPQAQPPYQAGSSHGGPEFGQAGSSSQLDRGSPWVPGLQENTAPAPHSGPPPPFPSHMGQGPQPTQSPQLTRDMEKALLQQVMNLTPEQINGLHPDQRNQVLQLREMLLRQ